MTKTNKEGEATPNNKSWEEHLESGERFDFEQWDVEKNTLSENEGEMVTVLTDKILPRHMVYFDWNLPFAQAAIVALRPKISTLLEQERKDERQRVIDELRKINGWECGEDYPNSEDCYCESGRSIRLEDYINQLKEEV